MNKILSALLTAALFYIIIILKKIFNIINFSQDASKKNNEPAAYNGKYYPATIIHYVIFNAKEDQIITDFSLYEKMKIVGFIVYTKKSREEYCDGSKVLIDFTKTQPMIIKDALVFEVVEGVWTWKFA